MLDDLRHALRRLRQRPGFTLVAVSTLALGLGANLAIFTLVYAVAYQPLPVRAPHELVRLGDDDNCCVNSGLQERYSLFSSQAFEHLRSRLPQLASVTAFQANPMDSAVRRVGTDGSMSAGTQFVTGGYFDTLGVAPARGRLLEPGDDRPGAPPVFVASHRWWRDRLGADPDAVGAPFVIGGMTMTLVGVSEAAFFGEARRPNPTDIWLPMGQEAAAQGDGSLANRPQTDWLRIIGRMAPGQSRDALELTATVMMRQWLSAQAFVSAEDAATVARVVVPIASAEAGVELMRFAYEQQLLLLFVMSGFVLLVATANLANLLLAGADRGQAAIRAALGASSGRMVRQSFIEGLVLAFVGAAAGIGVASLSTRIIVSMVFPDAAVTPLDVSISGAMLGFAIVLALVTGALFSAAPALALARVPPMDALRGAGRGGEQKSVVPRRALVVVQVALSFVLVSGAGLLTQSLHLLESQPLGFEADNRLVARLDLPATYAGDVPRLSALFRTLDDRVRQVPGIGAMTYALYTPMEGNNWSGSISIDGVESPDDNPLNSSWNRVARNFFDVLDIPVVRGRAFTDADTASAPLVVVVNQTFARRFFPDADPLGRRVGIGRNRAADYTIVGVTEDVKFSNPKNPTRPMIFLPDFQLVDYGASPAASVQARSTLMRMLVLRTNGPTGTIERDLRRQLTTVDPNLTLVRLMPMQTQVLGNFRAQRVLARLTSGYGLLALAVATLGLYAVTAYSVSRRRREIGVRMALGADRRRVILEIGRSALAQTALGLAIGIPAAMVAGNAIAAQLYTITPRDPLVMGVAVLVLGASAVLAAALPARRAASIDPTTALRSD